MLRPEVLTPTAHSRNPLPSLLLRPPGESYIEALSPNLKLYTHALNLGPLSPSLFLNLKFEASKP